MTFALAVQARNIKSAMENKTIKIKLLVRQNYLQAIKNSVGTKMFRNTYVLINGEEEDITNNGELSCALYVSSILKLFDLIKEKHTTVYGAVSDMLKNGWHQTKKPILGDILIWEEKDGHQHIGFYIGNHKAISNSSEKRTPFVHHYTFGQNGRKIIQVLTHQLNYAEKEIRRTQH